MRMSADHDETMSYVAEVFNAQKVHDIFREVIQNPKYKKAMIRLNARRRTTGGATLAVDTIERTYISGSDHLLDKGLIEKTSKWGYILGRCSICWLFLILIALIYFTVQYFILKNDYDLAIAKPSSAK